MKSSVIAFAPLLFVLLLCLHCGNKTASTVLFVTTTSFQDSGLQEVLIPPFEKSSDFTVKTIAVGTGQAIKLGERGEADLLLVHAPELEEKFIAMNYGTNRKPVMYNEFVIAGPPDDPAGIRGLKDGAAAFRKIAESDAPFISRGDHSGTNIAELKLWEKAQANQKEMRAYLETGQGMGATLTITSQKTSYTLTDRATFLRLGKILDLEILVQGDPALLNYYHVIEINPERWPKVNTAGAQALSNYLTSPDARNIISTFGTAEFGEQLFVPNIEH